MRPLPLPGKQGMPPLSDRVRSRPLPSRPLWAKERREDRPGDMPGCPNSPLGPAGGTWAGAPTECSAPPHTVALPPSGAHKSAKKRPDNRFSCVSQGLSPLIVGIIRAVACQKSVLSVTIQPIQQACTPSSSSPDRPTNETERNGGRHATSSGGIAWIPGIFSGPLCISAPITR